MMVGAHHKMHRLRKCISGAEKSALDAFRLERLSSPKCIRQSGAF
jgi:hypothetical protein